MRASKLILLSFFLVGCTNPPLSVDSMQADPAVYDQIEKDFYLKNKIAVAPIRSELPPKPLNSKFYNELYQDATLALARSLDKAGMLVRDTSKAQYILHATLIDVQDPKCFFGTCETGSAIKYQLKQGDNVVYDQTLAVPQNYDYPIFGADIGLVLRESYAVALGNNFAHLVHVLSNKTKGDLK